jgi:hypothetical protein
MNDALFIAACFGAAFLLWLLAVYIEARDTRDAAYMRDALSRTYTDAWHDSSSGDLIDVTYDSKTIIGDTQTETRP